MIWLKFVDEPFSVSEKKVPQIATLAVLDNDEQFAFDNVLCHGAEQIDNVQVPSKVNQYLQFRHKSLPLIRICTL